MRRLTGGVEGLLKKQKVTVLKGAAEIIDGKTVVVHSKAGVTRIRTKHLVLAAGSLPMQIGALPFGGSVFQSHRFCLFRLRQFGDEMFFQAVNIYL